MTLWGLDPLKYWIYNERRTKGCFACANSKRGHKKGRVRSYCQLEDMFESNYPDESEVTCKYWRSK